MVLNWKPLAMGQGVGLRSLTTGEIVKWVTYLKSPKEIKKKHKNVQKLKKKNTKYIQYL